MGKDTTKARITLPTGQSTNPREPDNPIDVNYLNANADYVAKTTLYRFLHHNDSLREPGSYLLTFYDNQNGNSIDLLMQAEQKLFEGSYSDARIILASVTSTNDIESNYKTFYTIYANYEEAEGSNASISITDSSALFALASLCPEANSSCVYQARALYNFIYKQCAIFPECEYSSGARPVAQPLQNKDQKINSTLKVDVFPNPTNNQVIIVSNNETEAFQVLIRDINGRIVFTKSIKPKGFISTLDFELINGIYFLTLNTNTNETVTKKLLISK